MYNNKCIFISGPVSEPMRERGWLHVYLKFNKTADTIRDAYPGVHVENPMDLCSPHWNWMRCMAKCLRRLRRCQAVVMMPGWESSRGSRTEHKVAKRRGIKIMYQKKDGCLIWHPEGGQR